MADKEITISSYEIHAYPGNYLPKNYLNYIRAKWMRSLRQGNDYYKLIDSNSFFEAYQFYIAGILKRPGTIVRLAVLGEEHDTALGFSVVENETLHYVYVYKDMRKMGIAKELVPSPISSITHLTKTGMRIWAKVLPYAKFNPFE